jgi:hypothetical protein
VARKLGIISNRRWFYREKEWNIRKIRELLKHGYNYNLLLSDIFHLLHNNDFLCCFSKDWDFHISPSSCLTS